MCISVLSLRLLGHLGWEVTHFSCLMFSCFDWNFFISRFAWKLASSSLETVRAECNATHYTVKNVTKESHESVKIKPMHCNDLQERFNALTREKNLLENRNNILRNMLKSVTEERDNLRNAQNCGKNIKSCDWRKNNT